MCTTSMRCAIRTVTGLHAASQDAGVATGLHYPRPVHLQPAYADLGYGPGSFPVAEALAAEFLSLPIFPELTSEPAAPHRRRASRSRRPCQGDQPCCVRLENPSIPKACSRVRLACVTGGAGFIGSHIVELLLDAGAAEVARHRQHGARATRQPRPRARQQPRAPDRGRHPGHGDDEVARRRLRHGLPPGRAAHHPLRARNHVPRSRSWSRRPTSCVELCLAANIRKLVAASSASVYGMADLFPTTEAQHPYNNRTLYGAAKAFNEGLYRSFNDMHGLDYVALRYFNVYGPRMDIHGRYTEVLVRWMERLARGEPPIIFGDGLQTMDMIHVRDVARANILSAIAPVSDVALNVGSGTETSLLDLARLLCRVMGQPQLVPLHQEARAVNPVPKRLADVSKAREPIGFE